MKKFKLFSKDEQGAVAVIVAVAMTALLGFTALTVDFGMYYYQKSKLQTAVDAAAKAAVYELPNTNAAKKTAVDYLKKNGFSGEDVEIEFSKSNTEISIDQKVASQTTFAKILNVDSINMKAHAKASVKTQYTSDVFDYLLFHGAKSELFVRTSTIYVGGNVHSNGDLRMTGSNVDITGYAQTCGDSDIKKGDGIDIREGVDYITMPDFTSVVNQIIPPSYDVILTGRTYNVLTNFTSTIRFNGDVTFNKGLNLAGTIYVKGNIKVNSGVTLKPDPVTGKPGAIIATGDITMASGFNGDGCIFAGGNIDITGNQTYITTNRSVAIYSSGGNVAFNTANTIAKGLIYAPNGTIKIPGGKQQFYGNIIANCLNITSSTFEIHPYDLSNLPIVIESIKTGSLIE